VRSALHPVPAVPTARERLVAVAELLDRATHDWAGDVLVTVTLDGEEVELGVRELDPALHPTVELADLRADPSWWALCLVTHGQARFLDALDQPPERIVSTYAVDREGHEVSLLRRGAAVEELPGPALGRVPDLLRTILAMPPPA
jgi:hypothetical protein